jgi:hypothetical protein
MITEDNRTGVQRDLDIVLAVGVMNWRFKGDKTGDNIYATIDGDETGFISHCVEPDNRVEQIFAPTTRIEHAWLIMQEIKKYSQLWIRYIDYFDVSGYEMVTLLTDLSPGLICRAALYTIGEVNRSCEL